MQERKTIIFVVSYQYLENPQYFAIIPYFKTYNTIYLLVSPNDEKINIEVSKSNLAKIQQFFSKFESIFRKQPTKEEKIKIKIPGFSILKDLRRHIFYKKTFFNFLNENKPATIITTSDMGYTDKLCSYWCKKKKKPLIIIQPSLIDKGIMKYPNKMNFRHKITYFIYNILFNIPKKRKQNVYGQEYLNAHLFLWGKYFILNKERKNTYFLGNAAFDNFFQNYSENRDILNKVIICTQKMDNFLDKEDIQHINDSYIKLIKKRKDIKFIIKVHPREDIKKYQEIFTKEHLPNIKIVKNENIHDLIKQCDLLITIMSYTILEAAAIGKPVITLNLPPKYLNFIDHFKNEINLSANNYEELSNAIDIIQSVSFWKKFKIMRKNYFEKIMHSTNGESGKNISEMIKKIIKDYD